MSAQLVERNYGAEPWRAPELLDGDQLVYDECGRILGNVCYRSHYYRLVKTGGWRYAIIVKHGAGTERINLGTRGNAIVDALALFGSDARYSFMSEFFNATRQAARNAGDTVSLEYRQAFADGRLKKRKARGKNSVRVWIEPATVTT